MGLAINAVWNAANMMDASFYPAERSFKLMRENLSPSQRKDYDTNHSFVVIGGTTGTRYRIRIGASMNVFTEKVGDLSKVGKTAIDIAKGTRLCFGPRGVPIGDVMLAQKVMLECDEPFVLRLAGKHHAACSW